MFNKWKKLFITAVCVIFAEGGSAQSPPATILEIDVENIVSYSSDVFDAPKFATDPNLTTVTAGARNFGFVIELPRTISLSMS